MVAKIQAKRYIVQNLLDNETNFKNRETNPALVFWITQRGKFIPGRDDRLFFGLLLLFL